MCVCVCVCQCRIKVARGPWLIIIRGAPSPRTCNICHFNGCKITTVGEKDKLSSQGLKEDGNFNRLIIFVNY